MFRNFYSQMDAIAFFLERIRSYGPLAVESQDALEKILRHRTYRKNEFLIQAGQHPSSIAVVCRGLFSQYFTSPDGDVVVKRFFPEGYFCTSMSALLSGTPSNFTIRALEDSMVLEYGFEDFKRLTRLFPDLADIYIRYLEIHWVIEKEPQEISLRYETAKTRYERFLKQYPMLEGRLKQHEVASYLGVTPTQLSRIRSEMPS